ncbi:J domain-containing protein [Hymenobacter rubripertinctus]|uniref:J domain-containing protein n=1 Tax=Hymenobacter rubripertinctus TaxID=2029981 RepID=A0A418QQ42_9BACT|nr:J domain-containing protein [Hymenobacter rubripertinctus]RIY07242.1 J domain-containing protein [Hymenobacter rubripertinctus]
MHLHNPYTDLPAANSLPTLAPADAPGTPAQRAFAEAVARVEGQRQRLRELKAEQAEARRRYWQQVGPAAATVVQARQALFAPLEEALLLGFFSRLEEQQLTALLLGNARALQDRFGEDAAEMLRKYAPRRRTDDEKEDDEKAAAPAGAPHEQAAEAARNRRKTKQQRAEEAAAQAIRVQEQALLANTKTLYRQLARAHHPDLSRDEATHPQRTELMQRITEAYETNDLYTMLQLLAETTATSPTDDTLLARYTEALSQQQTELKQQLQALQYGENGFSGSTGKKREQEIRQIKRHLKAEAEYLAQVLRLVQEPAGLRQLLRELAAEGHGTV